MMRYIGNGSFIPGIPARDLTDEEVKQHGGEKYLASTGLYIVIKSIKEYEKKPVTGMEDKDNGRH